MKSKIKYIFQVTNTLYLLDKIVYLKAKWDNRLKNRSFKESNPSFKLPSDYFLYETYKLDYEQYKEDGMLAAKEFYEWTKPYLPTNCSILEWGCGVARIIRHFNSVNNTEFKLFGADINEKMISWNKANIENVIFKTIQYQPPTIFLNNTFDLVYALSVFTHIEGGKQKEWLDEVARILKPNGIFLFSTHGTNYFDKLSESQMLSLKENGFYTISFSQKGHRMMTTYNISQSFSKILQNNFEIINFFEGKLFKEKVGGQDLWIVRKK